jgi:hypothetical protein
MPPPVPVIVIVYVFRFVLGLVVSVIVEEPVLDTATGFGLKDAVDLGGRLLALSCTFPVNPFAGVIVIVSGALDPCLTENAGAESVKLGAGGGACGVALAWLEFPLSPPLFTAVTT